MTFNYKKYFDWVADNDSRSRRWQASFHRQLLRLHRRYIPEGLRVLEWGCHVGTLLKGLKPARGVGLDISPKMIARAQKHPQGCTFEVGDLHATQVKEPFDVIILNYLTGYLQDIQKCLQNLEPSTHARTRLYLTSLNTVWLPFLKLGSLLGINLPQPPSNWLSMDDLCNLLELSGWEVVSKRREQLFPFKFPILEPFLNRVLIRFPFVDHLAATLFIVARPRKKPELKAPISCSVIVPTRNEAGSIHNALDRIPVMGTGTEVIFVEGGSRDNTWAVVQEMVKAYQGPLQVSCYQQPGDGKWDAVAFGFSKAQGDVLVIHDGDMTVPPEALPQFYDALASGTAEFVNGSRLVYPMEGQAMPFLNMLVNKAFAVILSFVLRQPIKDSLCGTKMLLKSDYERIFLHKSYFGDLDPFGDFTLLYGSARFFLKIRDVPIRYKDRIYGQTNIAYFKNGWILLKLVLIGLRRL